MNLFRPTRPTGSTPRWRFLQTVWDYLFGGKFPFIDTDSVKWSRSERGYSASVNLPAAGGSASSQIRGEWTDGVVTRIGEVWIIRTGADAGTYLKVANGTEGPSSSSGQWMTLWRQNQPAYWL